MSDWWNADPVAQSGNDWWAADPQAGASGTVADVAKSAGVGLGKAAIGVAGLAGDAKSLLDRGFDFVADKVLPLSPEVQQAQQQRRSLIPTTRSIQRAIEGITGAFYKPQTTAGKFAQTIGEFAPAAAMPAGAVARAANVVLPAVASETAGQLTEGTAAEPWARVAGAVVGGMAPAIASRAITPFPANAERQAAVEALRNEGVELTAGQATGSTPLRWFEGALGDLPGSGGRAGAIAERQKEQFTSAVLRRAGENAPRATPEVVDTMFTRIGQSFDDLAARNTATPDARFANDLTRVAQDYAQMVPTPAPIVENTLMGIIRQAQQAGGVIPGEVYQAVRSSVDRLARGTADNQLREALQGIRNAMDGVMERGMSGADRAAWRTARREYRNALVVERAAAGGGEDAALGLLSPAQVREATKAVQGRRNYARGDGDFAELARAGSAVMSPLPNSGTAPRTYAQNFFPSLVGAVSGGGAMGGPLGAAIGAATVMAPPVAGRGLMSGVTQGYLGNQLLPLAAPQRGAIPLRAYLAAPRGDQQ